MQTHSHTTDRDVQRKEDEPQKTEAMETATPEHTSVKSDLEQKAEEYLGGWKRALADYENLKRETAVRETELKKILAQRFAHDLLPIIDIYQQTVDHIPDERKKEPWYEGFRRISAEWERFMKDHGITRIESLGKPFDPNLHEAIASDSQEDKDDHTVLAVLSDGYLVDQTLIRPAKVTINQLKLNS